MNRQARFVVGLGVVIVLLVVDGWFDSVVVVTAQREVARTFDPDVVLVARSLGFLLIAASVLLVTVAGWRFRSIELGLAYVVVGAFFAFLDTITWKLAAQVNDAPPILPEPIVRIVNAFYPWEQGPLSATLIVGAGTLLVGIVLVGMPILRSGPPRLAAPGSSKPTSPSRAA